MLVPVLGNVKRSPCIGRAFRSAPQQHTRSDQRLAASPRRGGADLYGPRSALDTDRRAVIIATTTWSKSTS